MKALLGGAGVQQSEDELNNTSDTASQKDPVMAFCLLELHIRLQGFPDN
jgi:hypothetical protein